MLARLIVAFLAPLLLIASFAATAQPYPNKPIRLIVPDATGGSPDQLGRLLAQKLSESMGQQVIVDNRAGAAGVLAAEIAAKAPPDGYTLLMTTTSIYAILPNLRKNLPYDAAKDFVPVSRIATASNVLVVNTMLPANSIPELVKLAKEKPGTLNYASAGIGSPAHLAGEMFNLLAGVKMTHIPYKGAGPAVIELLAGHHVLYFGNVPSVINHARSGKLRAIAVTGAKRSTAAPDIPTVSESGIPGFLVTTWYGVSGPAKTPRPIVDKLHSEIVRALNSPDLKSRLTNDGADPVGNTPEQYTAFVESEIVKWTKVIKSAGIKAE